MKPVVVEKKTDKVPLFSLWQFGFLGSKDKVFDPFWSRKTSINVMGLFGYNLFLEFLKLAYLTENMLENASLAICKPHTFVL